jgi:hypothetical protein
VNPQSYSVEDYSKLLCNEKCILIKAALCTSGKIERAFQFFEIEERHVLCCLDQSCIICRNYRFMTEILLNVAVEMHLGC